MREVPSFAFELEVAVRVVRNNLPSVEVRPLAAGSNQVSILLEINLDTDDSASLQASISQHTEQLLSSFAAHTLPPPKWPISLAPQKLFNPHSFIRTLPKDKHVEYYVKGLY